MLYVLLVRIEHRIFVTTYPVACNFFLRKSGHATGLADEQDFATEALCTDVRFGAESGTASRGKGDQQRNV